MPDPALFSVWVVLISPAVGAFVAVLIDRLPRGESPVWPGSRCRHCAMRLGLRDLVPVLSFALLGGRCRHCGGAIDPWQLYVELAAIGLAVWAVLLGGGPVMVGLSALVLWTMLGLMVCDLLWFRLPDVLTGALAVWALALAGMQERVVEAVMGAVIGAGSFWLLRWGYQRVRGREGLGLGDVKLMLGLGALVGPWLVAHMVLLAALGALAVVGLRALMARGSGARRVPGGMSGEMSGGMREEIREEIRGSDPLPFGAALAAAGAVVWALTRLPV